jgi:hypothetical protein
VAFFLQTLPQQVRHATLIFDNQHLHDVASMLTPGREVLL